MPKRTTTTEKKNVKSYRVAVVSLLVMVEAFSWVVDYIIWKKFHWNGKLGIRAFKHVERKKANSDSFVHSSKAQPKKNTISVSE